MRNALILLAALSAAGAAWSQEPTRSRPQPVDPQTDPVNIASAALTEPALMMVIEIDGDAVTLGPVVGARAPISRAAPGEGETVTIVGFAGAERVSAVTIADQTQNILEEGGLVRTERRTLYAGLPLPRAIDAVAVTVNATGRTTRFSVVEQVREACLASPAEPACRGAAARQ